MNDILGCVGLKVKDLFPPESHLIKEGPYARDGRGCITNAEFENRQARIVATYDYTDALGNLLFQTVRFLPKRFRQRRPNGAGGWIWNVDGIEPVLYRLPALLDEDNHHEPVWVTEGEKDALSLINLGFTATTCAFGSSGWNPDYADTLKDRRVYVSKHNDKPGESFAMQVVGSLIMKGVPCVTDVCLDGLAHKEDVSDWLGRVPKAQRRQALLFRADHCSRDYVRC